MGMPINAIISITVSVFGVDDALYMVRPLDGSIFEGTILGKMLTAARPIIDSIVSDEARKARKNFAAFRPNGMYTIPNSNNKNKIQNSGLPSRFSKRYPASKKVYMVARK